MNVISSPWTWSIKRGTPLLLFVGLPSLLFLEKGEGFGRMGYLLMFVLFLVALVSWRLFIATLADEVQDHGDRLLVRRGADQETVPLANIMQVDESIGESQRIVLKLIKPGRLGRQIAFVPAGNGPLLGRHPVAEELIARVEQARQTIARKVPT